MKKLVSLRVILENAELAGFDPDAVVVDPKLVHVVSSNEPVDPDTEELE